MLSLLEHCHGENWKSPTRSFGRSGKAKRTFRETKKNVFVKPNEQRRACSNIVMARIGNRQHGALGEVERQNALFEERENNQELKQILPMKPNGKNICAALKQVRKRVADTNGIVYAPKECHFEGNCNGTCPACEAEVRYLEHQLNLLRKAGKAVTVMGVALGMTLTTGCKQGNTPKALQETQDSVKASENQITTGLVIPKERTTCSETDSVSEDSIGEIIRTGELG